MTSGFENRGAEFTQDLCSAIESYTASELGRNPRGYLYRGMQLRYAVERHLYIQCINSTELYNSYLENLGTECSTSALRNLNSIETQIGHFLFKRPVPQSHRLWRIVRRLVSSAKSVGAWWRYRSPSVLVLNSSKQRVAVLINVVNLKFARYLTQITEQLKPSSFAYLTVADTILSEQLKNTGNPIVRVSEKISHGHHIFVSSALSEFSRLLFDTDATLAALAALRPKCVVVVEGNAPIDAITAEACRQLEIPCYCIQQGWSPYIHNGFRNLDYTEMLVWGRRFAEMLRPHNPKQRFSVVGSHIVGGRSPRQAPQWIRALGFFLQAPCALLSLSSYNVFIDLIADVAQTQPDVQVIIREHPSYPMPAVQQHIFKNYLNVHFSVPAAEPLSETIAACDMVVSVFSTVLLEALAMGVVPMICSIGALNRYEPDIASTGAAIEVYSVAEALQTIHELIAAPERLTPIREAIAKTVDDFFSNTNAAEAIATRLQANAFPNTPLTSKALLPS